MSKLLILFFSGSLRPKQKVNPISTEHAGLHLNLLNHHWHAFVLIKAYWEQCHHFWKPTKKTSL